MKIPFQLAHSPVKRLTLRANHLYWRTYWNWYWNVRHNAFYAGIAKYPMALTVGVCSMRYVIGDLVAQKAGNNEYNKWRTATFFVFGCLSGYYAYGLYSKFYPLMMKRYNWSPVFCIVFENTFPCLFIYYGAFYLTQTLIEEGKFNVRKAFDTANQNRIGDMKSLWAFWGPIHFVSFKYVPPNMRGMFAAVVGSLWVVVLSTLRGDKDAHAVEQTEDDAQLKLEPVAEQHEMMRKTLPVPELVSNPVPVLQSIDAKPALAH